MSMQGYQETLITAQGDGTALTAAAAATCLPAQARRTLAANLLDVTGKQLLVRASGRISCAVTTPGTARFDVRFGGTVVADTQAMNLNIVAKASVNWYLEMLLTLRAVGAAANFILGGYWLSEAGIGNPLPTVGGSAPFTIPYNTAPVVGSNFDSTAAQQVDFFFTQTVATGSMTLHEFALVSCN